MWHINIIIFYIKSASRQWIYLWTINRWFKHFWSEYQWFKNLHKSKLLTLPQGHCCTSLSSLWGSQYKVEVVHFWIGNVSEVVGLMDCLCMEEQAVPELSLWTCRWPWPVSISQASLVSVSKRIIEYWLTELKTKPPATPPNRNCSLQIKWPH